ncbi:MAG: hypothetical protein HY079_13995 [Elusimicrobia bacterium]|nr:hypothetical protein [Elusimicrobiota bacterium]
MGIVWREHRAGDADGIRSAARELGVHPLALEDCLKRNQRAKFEDYGTHQLLVWFVCLPEAVVELEFVVFPKTVLLVADGAPPRGATWREFLGVGEDAPDAAHLLYQALDAATDATEGRARTLAAELPAFEEALFRGRAQPRRLVRLKRELGAAAHATASLASVAAQWERFLSPGDDLRWRMRDLIDHCERVQQSLVFHQAQVSGAMDMYWGLNAQRTNDQIKRLTVMASVAVPLTVWASFWGMNFTVIPFHSPGLFVGALAAMGASVAAALWGLKARGFLDD